MGDACGHQTKRQRIRREEKEETRTVRLTAEPCPAAAPTRALSHNVRQIIKREKHTGDRWPGEGREHTMTARISKNIVWTKIRQIFSRKIWWQMNSKTLLIKKQTPKQTNDHDSHELILWFLLEGWPGTEVHGVGRPVGQCVYLLFQTFRLIVQKNNF